jgi:hypothetical protein
MKLPSFGGFTIYNSPNTYLKCHSNIQYGRTVTSQRWSNSKFPLLQLRHKPLLLNHISQ